ncbi:UNVERIFIED_CONTAM: Cyclin-P3-1 [Sesamum angustifolium]|uniref:Cyclin-P3-1 n=1 Tax=Sesamum angustifolium TaxID=2727405 RepID=A0AAW2QT53_9LAMI
MIVRSCSANVKTGLQIEGTDLPRTWGFIQRTNMCLTSLNIHRLLITSVMVAAKFMDDAFFNNAYYARVGGVSTAELNKLEMKFLFSLDFQLHVSVQTFRKYCSVLRKDTTGGLIERPIQACGMKESWVNKDDPASALYRWDNIIAESLRLQPFTDGITSKPNHDTF